MAALTFEHHLLSSPTFEPRRPARSVESPQAKVKSQPSFAELMGVVSYNQGLVEFADSKAGSLILLNSLLIAAVGALPNSGSLGTFKLLSVVLCSAAVYVCFQVISSKESDLPEGQGRRRRQEWEQNDFLFFGSISKHRSGEEFCRAFEDSDDAERKRSLLQRAYIISGIARRKFEEYKTAQKITSVALVVWVAVNLFPFLAR